MFLSLFFFTETTSKFGSGLFLLVQVILLLDFVHRWNDTWVGYDEQFWLVYTLGSIIALYPLKFITSTQCHFFFGYSTRNRLILNLHFWCRYIALFVVSLFCYVATFVFSGLLFHWFTPSGHDCGLNTFFIVMTLISVFVSAIVALHPTVSYYLFIYLHEPTSTRVGG